MKISMSDFGFNLACNKCGILLQIIRNIPEKLLLVYNCKKCTEELLNKIEQKGKKHVK